MLAALPTARVISVFYSSISIDRFHSLHINLVLRGRETCAAYGGNGPS